MKRQNPNSSFYKKTLATWPVPYEEIMVQTRYGDTHVITSGTKEALTTASSAVATPGRFVTCCRNQRYDVVSKCGCT